MKNLFHMCFDNFLLLWMIYFLLKNYYIDYINKRDNGTSTIMYAFVRRLSLDEDIQDEKIKELRENVKLYIEENNIRI